MLKMECNKLLLQFLCILLLTTSVYASPEEYLLFGESLGKKLITIEINGEDYVIYDINNKQIYSVLVIGPDNYLASDEHMEKALFSYDTHLYMKDHHKEIADYYQSTRNNLSTEAESSYQQILDAFKKIPEVCAPVPDFEIISLCVKPTDRLGVMKYMGTTMLDWNEVLENYRKLGGDLFYTLGSEKIKYSDINGLYENLIAMHNFLTTAKKITNIDFIREDLLNPNKIAYSVSRSTSSDVGNINERIEKLKKEEKSKFNQTKKELEDVGEIIKEITKINGDYENLNSQRESLKNKLDQIDLNDEKLRTDINRLNNLSNEIKQLNITSKSSYQNYLKIYNDKGFLDKQINNVIGLFNLLFTFYKHWIILIIFIISMVLIYNKYT